MKKADLDTAIKSRRFGVIAKVPRIFLEEGIENNVLRLCRRSGISTLEEYIIHNRWGFNKSAGPDDVETIAIDPGEVCYTHRFPFDVRGENAVVGEGGGPWYRCVQRFDQYRLFRAMRDRFIEGKRWEETEMYQIETHRIKRGEKSWNGCTTAEEIEERCESLDRLYEEIKEHGYLSQEELRASFHHDDGLYYREVNGVTVPDELRVAIGPDGQLIRISGGRHRLSIAKLLGIEEIPAVVQIVHERLSEADLKQVT